MIIHSLAPSSRTTYRRALLLFITHTRQANLSSQQPFPASVPAIISYITHLFSLNYAPATITTFVSAIAFANKLHNSFDPHKHFLIIKMLEGSRKMGHTADTRQPITLAILHRLTAAVPIIHHTPFNISLLRAMFLLAFHALLRVGEITVRSQTSNDTNTLQAADCSITLKGGQVVAANLTLRNSKHNKAKPFHITIPATNTSNCPAVALHTYLQLARPRQGPLFQLQSGTPVTRHYFQAQLHKCLQAAKINTNLYKSHSFRIGAATEAVASLGLTDQEVQRLGRWGSNAFKSYIRSPTFTAIPHH